jgi:hypothetical protein
MISLLSRRRSSPGNSSRRSNASSPSSSSELSHSSRSESASSNSHRAARNIFGSRHNNSHRGNSNHGGNPESIPIETVRDLLIGAIDPVEFAREHLPPRDVAAVIAYNCAPYRPALDLKRHDIRTVEDVLFVGLCYVGFEAQRQNIRHKVKEGRFCAHFKLIPQTVLDVWHWLNENDEEGIEFHRLLYSLNFLKLCKYHGAATMNSIITLNN